MGRGRRIARPSVIGGGGGADEVSDWALVSESAWSAVNDPAVYLTASSKTDGTLTFTTGTFAVACDGYQDSCPNFEVMLNALYPDFDLARDRLEFRMDIAAMPLNANKWGLGVWIIDNATIASAIGTGLMLYPNSTTVVNAAQMGATGAAVTAAANGSNLDVPAQMFGSIAWGDDGVPVVTGRLKKTSTQQEITKLSSPNAAMSTTLANIRLRCGAVHLGTGGANTVSARLYTRRVRTSGFFA